MTSALVAAFRMSKTVRRQAYPLWRLSLSVLHTMTGKGQQQLASILSFDLQ